MIHTKKETKTVRATKTILVAKKLLISTLTRATAIAPAHVILSAVSGAVKKMTGALTRTALASLI